jgi:hypothetical protein
MLYLCCFLLSVNLRGIHLAQTLRNCDMCTMKAAVPGRCRSLQCSCLAPSVCSLMRALLSALIDNFRHKLRLSSVTLFLPYVNVRHHLENRWLYLILLYYTTKQCWWTLDAENILDHKCTYIATSSISKPETFSMYVATLNCSSCAHIAHVPRITWPWILQSSVKYTYTVYKAFENSSTSAFWITWLVNILTELRSTSISKFQVHVYE